MNELFIKNYGDLMVNAKFFLEDLNQIIISLLKFLFKL